MRVITFSKSVSVTTKTAGQTMEVACNALQRYIFSDDDSLAIQQDPGSARYIDKVDDLTPYLQELVVRRPSNWRKTRILFYRGRGIGDQLIASSLSRFFAEMLAANCYQAVERIHEPLWTGNHYIGGAPLLMPISLDSVYRLRGPNPVQGAFFFESVSEWDSDGEQPNVYDRLFSLVGLDIGRVPAKYKRPFFSLTKADLDLRAKWLARVSQATNKPNLELGYLFLQVSTTNKVRSLPLPLIEKVLYAMDEFASKLQIPILVADSLPLSPEIVEMIKRTRNAIDVATAIPYVRLLAAVISGATIVVGPDSSALHIAAAFETPAIGLWGPFSPSSRTQYYPRQIHLFHPDRCAAAPCFNYLPDLPVTKCPDGINQKHCAVFDGITADEIFSALKEVNA